MSGKDRGPGERPSTKFRLQLFPVSMRPGNERSVSRGADSPVKPMTSGSTSTVQAGASAVASGVGVAADVNDNLVDTLKAFKKTPGKTFREVLSKSMKLTSLASSVNYFTMGFRIQNLTSGHLAEYTLDGIEVELPFAPGIGLPSFGVSDWVTFETLSHHTLSDFATRVYKTELQLELFSWNVGMSCLSFSGVYMDQSFAADLLKGDGVYIGDLSSGVGLSAGFGMAWTSLMRSYPDDGLILDIGDQFIEAVKKKVNAWFEENRGSLPRPGVDPVSELRHTMREHEAKASLIRVRAPGDITEAMLKLKAGDMPGYLISLGMLPASYKELADVNRGDGAKEDEQAQEQNMGPHQDPSAYEPNHADAPDMGPHQDPARYEGDPEARPDHAAGKSQELSQQERENYEYIRRKEQEHREQMSLPEGEGQEQTTQGSAGSSSVAGGMSYAVRDDEPGDAPGGDDDDYGAADDEPNDAPGAPDDEGEVGEQNGAEGDDGDVDG